MSSVGGAVAAEAAEPEAKRRRLLDAGGPVEDDETARQKMRDAMVGEVGKGLVTGFDPQNVVEVKGLRGASFSMTPMGYFSFYGDLPMMRWLFVHGAGVRDLDSEHWFPMYAAVSGKAIMSDGLVEKLVKWLYLRGAAKDVTRRNASSWSPFAYLLIVKREISCIQWLILNGALCQDNDNEFGLLDVGKLERSLGRARRIQSSREKFANARRDLLQWAVELHQTRTSFLTFLCGTLSRQGRVDPPLVSLGGSSGIMEPVADYLGVIRGREARIIRQLVELLPSIYRKLEDIEDGWENS